MLSKEQQEYLCDGYIRHNCTHSTPISINRIIQTFWNEHIWWTFKGKKLTQLLSAKVKEEFSAPKFKLHDILFMPVLYPNGDLDQYGGDVVYGVDTELPSHINTAMVYYELYCIQTNAFYRDSFRLLPNGGNLLLWTEPVKLSQCKDETQLDFMYFVETLHIEYSEECDKENYCKPIEISKQSECKWNIDSKVIQSWKTCHSPQCTCGPSFDDNCWLLWCTPKGYGSKEQLCIGVNLLQYTNRKEINAKIVIDIEPNVYHFEKTQCVVIREMAKEPFLSVDTKITLEEVIDKAKDTSISIHCRVELIDSS